MGNSPSRTSIDRREAVRLLAGGCAAAVSVANLPRAFAAASLADPSGLDPIRALVRSPDCAARLAARLEQRCGGPDGVEEVLADELAALRRHAIAATTPQQLAATLQQAVRDDFAARRVIMLDGWMLTRTELALCCVATGFVPPSAGGALS